MKCLYRQGYWPVVIASVLLLVAQAADGVTLTIADVRSRALDFNRGHLVAREEVVKAQADIVKARAGAFPKINLESYYSRSFRNPSLFWTEEDSGGVSSTTEIQMGFRNNFGASLSMRQSIWQGGKVFTALSIAKLYRKYAQEVAAETKADVKCQAEVLFYSAVLQHSRLAVLQKSFEANSYNLEVVEKFFSQGLVSEFELLRARVEKANLMPEILRVESELRLSKKRLKSFLGIDLNEEIMLVDEVGDTTLLGLPPLYELIDSALARRPEMLQLDNLTSISKKAIRIARGDYYPSLEAVSRYDWQSQSDAFTLDENISRSWTAGLNLSIPIFRGGETRGAVTQAVASHQQARLAAAQLRDDIELEVEESYDRVLQAKRLLDIQGETIAQAEEGLKIANLRYESGVGTQLEVLSAQAALTAARTAQAEATYFFRTAKSSLKRATTIDIEKME